MKQKYLTETEEFISELGLRRCTAKILPRGTILFTIFAAPGEVCILDIAAATNQAIAGIVIESDRVDRDYLYHCLCAQKPYVHSIRRGAAQNNINLDILRNLEVSLPPLHVQREIAAALDRLNRVISLRERQLVLLEELVKSKFAEIFGSAYPEDTLHHLCNIVDYRGKTPEKSAAGLPFITAKNIKMHRMHMEPRAFISRETYDRCMVKGLPREGDVVFTTEAPLGNVCRIPHFDTEFYIGQRIVTLQTAALEPAYLEYALDTPAFKRKLSESSTGSTVTGIRVRVLKQLTIPVPPVHLQRQFAAFAQQADRTGAAVQRALEGTRTLLHSLLQTYFGPPL